jgi:hypothetical protein
MCFLTGDEEDDGMMSSLEWCRALVSLSAASSSLALILCLLAIRPSFLFQSDDGDDHGPAGCGWNRQIDHGAPKGCQQGSIDHAGAGGGDVIRLVVSTMAATFSFLLVRI